MMDFRILGPLEVRRELAVIPLSGAKQRALLATLLLRANEPVSAEQLAQALWGDEAPAGAVRTVQVHVSRLRKALGNGEIVTTTPAGYRLQVEPGELDAERFEHLVEDARRALRDGRPDEAAGIVREALTLWRGPPLADLAFEPFAQRDIARLDEQRLAAIEVGMEAGLAAGRHAELVADLRRLVAEHPTSERLAALLMLALYRSGRQTEALEAYHDARRKLADEIGVEPGPELRDLQEAVLRHDPSLRLRPPAGELPRELDVAVEIVGRDEELAWLRAQWHAAQAGPGTVLALVGPHGIGKTRLAAELAQEAHRDGATVLYASGPPAIAALGPEQAGYAGDATRPVLVVADDAGGADSLMALRGATLVLAIAEDLDALDGLGPDAALALKRLDTEAVRAIAHTYVRDHPVEDVPAPALLDASGGIPRRVHEVARTWARGEAARRVEAIAGPAAVGRAELRSMEDELVGGIVQFQTTRELVEAADTDDGRVICPFKGLASFEADDAPYFFGRERLIAELVARLVGAPLLGVVGPSGSGKSSVVKAGLLPALAGGVLPGSERWQQVVMRPGEHPLGELHVALDGLDAGPRMVLAVDQFEETFTACRDAEERAAFVSELVQVARDRGGSLVILTIRADFYGRCAAYPELSRLLAANHVLVGALSHEELRQAVVYPARRVGLHVEPELADALVDDVADEPGALPLLSSALLELWQRRTGRRLRYASYEQTGGVRGAVARLAENAFAELDDDQQALARGVLLQLAEVDDERGVERRRLPLSELHSERGADATHVIGLLADRRLLTISEGAVEVAHEALLREWPRLRAWIDEDRDGLRIERNLRAAAQEWVRLGRDDGALYRGAHLHEARAWSARGRPSPTESEREFLGASVDYDRRERRSHRRRVTFAFGALALGIVVITAVAVVAVGQRRDAERQRNFAVSRELALQSGNMLDVDPALGVRLALWAEDTAPTDESAAALRQATAALHKSTVLRADSMNANTAAFSPDGDRVVTGGSDGIARVWDAATRREVAHLDAGRDAVMSARYAPGGERIALGFADGAIVVTDPVLADPRVLTRVPGARVQSIAFGAERIAAGFDDGTVRVLEADGNGPVQVLRGHQGAVHGVDISADGSRVASAGDDGDVRLWDAAGGGPGQVLHDGSLPEADVAFSPDGNQILGVGHDRRVRLWNARTGAQEANMSGEGRILRAAAFSPDGERFAAGGSDGVIRVWSVAGGPPVAVLRGQRAWVVDIGFGPTGDRVVSAADDGTVWMWDAGRTLAWTVPSLTYDIDFNRDGRLLATSSDDGTMRVWDTATGSLHASLPGPDGYTAGKFSPVADELVVLSDATSRLRLWPVASATADVLVQLPEGRGMNSANFDASGERVVYVDASGHVVVRELDSGREVTLGGTPNVVWGAEFTPDGDRVVAVPNRDVLVWRLDRPDRPERVLRGHRGPVNALAFTPDGRIVTAGADRTVRIWDPADGSAIVMRGHQDEVTTVLVTATGRQVLSASQDGTVRLWDSRTGEQLASLQTGEGELYDIALSRDGKIATLGKGDVVQVFDCDFCGSLDRVREVALDRTPRPLTTAERAQFLAAAE
jgi:WD40 repeat protein/DNA-binding SARP family transcriptional activator